MTMVDPIASVCSTHPLCRFMVRRTRLPRRLSRPGSLASPVSSFVRSFRPSMDRISWSAGRAPSRDVQNPAEPPPSVALSVVAPCARCRNVRLCQASATPTGFPPLAPD